MTETKQPISGSSRKERILTTTLIVIGLILVIFFSLRAVRSYIRIRQTGLEPGVTDVEAIRGWMTIPYIATAYDVPETYIFEQIGVPQAGNQNKSLRRLNQEYAPDQQAQILNAVKAAIRNYQAQNPTPPGAGLD